MSRKAITLQQLEEALRDVTRWIREKLVGYVQEPTAEGKSGYVLTTNGAGGRSWEKSKTEDGVWRPSVSDEGVLSWARSAEESAPEAQSIRGPKGDTGPQGPQGPPGEGVSKLVVTLMSEDMENWTADKSFAEIAAALESGGEVEASLMGMVPMAFVGTDGSSVLFQKLGLTADGALENYTAIIMDDDTVTAMIQNIPLSGGGGMVVNVTTEDGETFNADKTYEEIAAAVESGTIVVANATGAYLPMLMIGTLPDGYEGVMFQTDLTVDGQTVVGTVIIQSDNRVFFGQGLASGGGQLVVTFTEDGNGGFTASATYEEVLDALQGGVNVVGFCDDEFLQLHSATQYAVAFYHAMILAEGVTSITFAAVAPEGEAYVERRDIQLSTRDFVRDEVDFHIDAAAVRFDKAQSLSATQQAQARANIGVTATDLTGAVRYDTGQTISAVQKPQARENIGIYMASVKDYYVDDDWTDTFRRLLTANRVVHVPSGTYNLAGEIVIPPNCSLVLEQDTVLNFTNTSGNCISMHASASIIGNHGVIKVPYGFTGKVINIDAGLDESIVGVPPFTAWGPMYVAGRFITDLHIGMFNSVGTAWSDDGVCTGTAVYLRASYEDPMHFMWAINLDGLRIAGGFKYGVHMDVTPDPDPDSDDGWIHQTRISGFIEGCEVGVYCKDANMSYLSVMVIPRVCNVKTTEYPEGVPYAMNGFVLERCSDVDMSGARVIDWDARRTLWTEDNENQHIKLIGDCHGLILNDILYYGDRHHDIRDLIWTDTPDNLENINILQEPFTRWFKPREGVPYFYDGFSEKQLALQEELKEIVDAERTPGFTNKIPTAVGLDGTILNGAGYYKSGYRWGSDGTLVADEWFGCTGLIPAKPGDVIRAENLSLIPHHTRCLMMFFDENRSYVAHMNNWDNIAAGNAYYWLVDFVESDAGFEVKIADASGDVQQTAYVAFTFQRANIGDNPVITVNEPITYTQEGYLQDGIKVKVENVEGLDAILGSYINDVDALLGGG